MAASRAGVWCVFVLLLTATAFSALSDPFFDHVSGDWQAPGLESETEPRPVWRIPGTIERLSFAPVLLPMALVTPADPRPAPLLFARPPFVPPRG